MRIGMMTRGSSYGGGATDTNARLDSAATEVVSQIERGKDFDRALSEAVDRYKLEGMQITILAIMVKNRLRADLRVEVAQPVANTPLTLRPEVQTNINLKPQPQPQVQPVAQKTPKDYLEEMMSDGLLKREDQEIIDKLPELLGFKFCPRLFVDSGILPPLEGDFVPPEYERAYLENMIGLLKILNELLTTKAFDGIEELYAKLPGGLLPSGKLNPVFPRNLWLNALGYRLTDDVSDPNTILQAEDLLPIQERIMTRVALAQQGIDQINQTIAELEALAIQQAEQQAAAEQAAAEQAAAEEAQQQQQQQETEEVVTVDEEVLLPAVDSDIPAPIVPFYKKTSNQAIALALITLVGLYAYSRSKK